MTGRRSRGLTLGSWTLLALVAIAITGEGRSARASTCRRDLHSAPGLDYSIDDATRIDDSVFDAAVSALDRRFDPTWNAGCDSPEPARRDSRLARSHVTADRTLGHHLAAAPPRRCRRLGAAPALAPQPPPTRLDRPPRGASA
ncbi:MAG: hypothetical protein SFX72_21420 [Isosphaeraceae bacterium]|nr:hypothetical protein [Isosphaeraceae bacterium]